MFTFGQILAGPRFFSVFFLVFFSLSSVLRIIYLGRTYPTMQNGNTVFLERTQFKSHRITSHHITSHQITLRHVTSRHVTSTTLRITTDSNGRADNINRSTRSSEPFIVFGSVGFRSCSGSREVVFLRWIAVACSIVRLLS